MSWLFGNWPNLGLKRPTNEELATITAAANAERAAKKTVQNVANAATKRETLARISAVGANAARTAREIQGRKEVAEREAKRQAAAAEKEAADRASDERLIIEITELRQAILDRYTEFLSVNEKNPQKLEGIISKFNKAIRDDEFANIKNINTKIGSQFKITQNKGAQELEQAAFITKRDALKERANIHKTQLEVYIGAIKRKQTQRKKGFNQPEIGNFFQKREANFNAQQQKLLATAEREQMAAANVESKAREQRNAEEARRSAEAAQMATANVESRQREKENFSRATINSLASQLTHNTILNAQTEIAANLTRESQQRQANRNRLNAAEASKESTSLLSNPQMQKHIFYILSELKRAIYIDAFFNELSLKVTPKTRALFTASKKEDIYRFYIKGGSAFTMLKGAPYKFANDIDVILIINPNIDQADFNIIHATLIDKLLGTIQKLLIGDVGDAKQIRDLINFDYRTSEGQFDGLSSTYQLQPSFIYKIDNKKESNISPELARIIQKYEETPYNINEKLQEFMSAYEILKNQRAIADELRDKTRDLLSTDLKSFAEKPGFNDRFNKYFIDLFNNNGYFKSFKPALYEIINIKLGVKERQQLAHKIDAKMQNINAVELERNFINIVQLQPLQVRHDNLQSQLAGAFAEINRLNIKVSPTYYSAEYNKHYLTFKQTQYQYALQTGLTSEQFESAARAYATEFINNARKGIEEQIRILQEQIANIQPTIYQIQASVQTKESALRALESEQQNLQSQLDSLPAPDEKYVKMNELFNRLEQLSGELIRANYYNKKYEVQKVYEAPLNYSVFANYGVVLPSGENEGKTYVKYFYETLIRITPRVRKPSELLDIIVPIKVDPAAPGFTREEQEDRRLKMAIMHDEWYYYYPGHLKNDAVKLNFNTTGLVSTFIDQRRTKILTPATIRDKYARRTRRNELLSTSLNAAIRGNNTTVKNAIRNIKSKQEFPETAFRFGKFTNYFPEETSGGRRHTYKNRGKKVKLTRRLSSRRSNKK